MSFIIKVIKRTVTQKDIENELYEICDREHASCNNYCPIYELGLINPTDEDCDYFKSGKKMFNAIKSLD